MAAAAGAAATAGTSTGGLWAGANLDRHEMGLKVIRRGIVVVSWRVRRGCERAKASPWD